MVKAAKEYIAENLDDLPRLIEQAIEDHLRHVGKAA